MLMEDVKLEEEFEGAVYVDPAECADSGQGNVEDATEGVEAPRERASPSEGVRMTVIRSFLFDAGLTPTPSNTTRDNTSSTRSSRGSEQDSNRTSTPSPEAPSRLLASRTPSPVEDIFFERRRRVFNEEESNEIAEAMRPSCALPFHYVWDDEAKRSVRVKEGDCVPRQASLIQQTRPYQRVDPASLYFCSQFLQRNAALLRANGLGTDAEGQQLRQRLSQLNDGNFVRGCVGLMNAGNTCFMNSVLQCLSHTPELRDYFLSQGFFSHINKRNVVGSEGRVAMSFHALLRALWHAGSESCSFYIKHFAPLQFKQSITSFFQNYAYNQQHDAHEFLVFLLDGLHEDCNRVLKKPYFEGNDSDDDGTDTPLAQAHKAQVRSAAAWQNQLARNKSIVHDLFYFQFKSLTCCDVCGKHSYLFDPVSCIQLPVINEAMENLMVNVVYVPRDVTLPEMHVKLCVKKHGTASQITRDVEKLVRPRASTDACDTDTDVDADDTEQHPDGARVVTMQMFEPTETLLMHHLKETEILSHRFLDTSSMPASPPFRRGLSPMHSPREDDYIPLVYVYEHEPVLALAPPKKCDERPTENLSLVVNVLHFVMVPGGLSDEEREEEEEEEEDEEDERMSLSHSSVITLTRDSSVAELTDALMTEGMRVWGGLAIETDTDGDDDMEEMVMPIMENIYGPDTGAQASLVPWDITTLDMRAVFNSICRMQYNRSAGKRLESDLLNHKTLTLAVRWRGKSSIDDFYVPLPALKRPPAVIKTASKSGRFSKSRVVTLEQCFEQHNKTEQLDATSSWNCSRCKKPQCAYRSLSIYSLPQYLVIHLKKNYLTPSGYVHI